MTYTHTILVPKTLVFNAEYYNCSRCGKRLEKHIVCEGARFHVTSWTNLGTRCSAPLCEHNHKCKKERQEQNGST